MERIIVTDMLYYLRLNGLISKEQHGFLSRKSTTSNLLETINDWTLAINDRNAVSAIYIDFAKAFDTVCHNKLSYKLTCYGIAGSLLKWINSFLFGRSQCTRINHTCSMYTNISSGVPQGSVLGPLLFLLYINDVVDIFDRSCKCKLYADDLKLYSVIQTAEDCALMQRKLDEILLWSNQWQLTISYAKCNAMFIGKCNASLNANYSINSKPIPVVESIKDLGVTIDSDCKFNNHISHIVARAHTRANLIHKCFTSKDPSTLVRAFTTYVRPLLEYGSCIWSPCTATLITKLESVQRRFTKRLANMTLLNYSTRLSILSLESLQTRRLYADLIYVYKILFNVVDVDSNVFFKLCNTFISRPNTRGHDFKLYVEHCRINTRKTFFCNRVIKVWNDLPAKNEHFLTLSSFKRFLKSINLSDFCIYTLSH